MEEHEITSLLPPWLVHSKNYSLVITDLEGNYIYTNDIFKSRFSFLASDFTGMPFSESIHPADTEKCNLAAYHCITHPDEVVAVKVRKPDNLEGDFYWTQWEFSLFKDKNNEPKGILCIGHDITESMRTAQMAIEFAEKTEKIIENFTDGFYVLDKEWRFIKTNRVTENIFNISQENLIGKVIWDIFPEDTHLYYAKQFRKAVLENITVNFEDYNQLLQQWFKFTAYSSPEGLTVFFRDVTLEHQIQAELKNSEYKLRAILDSSTDSNILISPDLKVLSVDKTAKRDSIKTHGQEIKEGDDFSQYIVKGTEKEFKEDFTKALAGENTILEKELLFENGLSMWFEVSYAPVYDEDGKIMGVSFNATDINQRKQAEQKLIESEYMLSAIYNSTSEANSFISLDFKLLYFNKVASEMIQDMFQKEPQIGDDYFDYILPHLKEEFRQDFEEVLKGNTIRKEKTDGAKWYQLSIFPVYNLNNELVGLADNVIDITESKQNELQIIAQNEKLKAIAWHQAHKVRRPVATILGLIALIKEENDLSEILLYIDFLQHATNELDQVIHTIVGYTQDIK